MLRIKDYHRKMLKSFSAYFRQKCSKNGEMNQNCDKIVEVSTFHGHEMFVLKIEVKFENWRILIFSASTRTRKLLHEWM